MLIPPKKIVLTGGSLRCLGHFGALQVLEEKGLLKAVKEYVGVSAGALTGFMMILGYTLEELHKTVVEFDFTVLQNVHPELALEFFNKYGIDTGEQLEKFVKSLLRVKQYPDTITFAQWSAQYPKQPRLRCYATNLNKGEIKEFSLEKTPHTSLVFALRASMSLPLYFTPVIDPESGNLLVDGGVIHNFPMNFLNKGEREESLGISFLYSKQKEKPIEDFLGLLTQLYNCGFNPRTYQVQEENKLRCIVIPTNEMSAYNFDYPKEFREDLIECGRVAAREFCDTYLDLIRQHNRPIRRYSVS
jgi:NTE family protein